MTRHFVWLSASKEADYHSQLEQNRPSHFWVDLRACRWHPRCKVRRLHLHDASRWPGSSSAQRGTNECQLWGLCQFEPHWFWRPPSSPRAFLVLFRGTSLQEIWRPGGIASFMPSSLDQVELRQGRLEHEEWPSARGLKHSSSRYPSSG